MGVPGVSATPLPSASRYSFTVIPFRLVSPVPSLFVSALTLPLISAVAFTVSVSLAVLPVPPLVELTFPLVLAFAPALVTVTSTSTVQVPLAAIVPPLKLKLVSSADGDHVGVPHPLVEASGVPATFTPLGKLSVKATPVRAVALLGFVIVNFNVEVPFTTIGSDKNSLLMLGGSNTVRSSLAALPVRDTGPLAVGVPVVFVTAPAVELVTLITT